MRQRYKTLIYLFIATSLVFACSDIIEESIGKEKIQIIAPLDGTRSTTYTQTFWWEEVQGALDYRLQIVYNRYDSIPLFRLDTTINKNRFAVTLKPGRYQWRLWALNGSSSTDSVITQNLWIDSTSIEGQDIILSSPAADGYSNQSNVEFGWEELSGALEYKFQASGNNSFENSDLLIIDSVLRINSFEYSFPTDTTFYWRIIGRRNEVLSNPSISRKFTIDKTSPSIVQLESPDSVGTEGLEVQLKWSTSTDKNLSHYKVYVYKDKLGTQSYNATFPYDTKKATNPLNLTYNFTGKSGEKLYWRIKAVDKAGNESAFSDMLNFTIE